MATGLLLLHAFPLDHTMWEPQREEFEHVLPVVAPDLFEAGAGHHAATMDAAADAAVRALDGAGLDDAVVCGLSLGGYVAFVLHRRHRDRVTGIVLANTRATADDAAAAERRNALAARLLAEGAAFLADSPPALLSSHAGGELLARVKNMIGSQPPQSLADASTAMALRPDSTPGLSRITVPALAISGDGDTLIPAAETEAMARGIPGSRFEIIARAGHLTNLEQPEAFNRLLREHLVRCGIVREGLPKGVRSARA
ncbi:MAG: alpha/beta fold hydrolase [Chloroflexi bacterium]|nr:alpha/beta fold hydrolase [Chloroflexota bacterium]